MALSRSSSFGSRRSGARRRRRATPRWRFAAGLGLFVVALAAGIILADLPHAHRTGATAPAPSATDGTEAAAAEGLPRGAGRPVYPFSVVEGGVGSIEELREAIARDPVVAAHYRNFDLSKARIEPLASPRVAHVSYRMGDSVYWTKNPVVVPAGEAVITDGEHVARARCANQLDDDPGDISPDEPDPAVLDTPSAPRGGPLALLPRTIGTPAPAATGPNGGQGAGRLAALAGAAAGGGGRPVGAVPTGTGSGTSEPQPQTPAPQPPVTPPGTGNPAPPQTPPPAGVPGEPGQPPSVPPAPPPSGPPDPTVPPGPPAWLPPGPPGHPPIPPGPMDPWDPWDPWEPEGPYDPPGPPGSPPGPSGNPPDPFDPGDPPGPRDIPEPGTTVLLLGGAAVLALRRLRNAAAARE